MKKSSNEIWRARKRNLLFFGLPLTFTVYSLDDDTFNTEKGFLNKTYEEIRLFRIRDFTIKRSLFQRIFGLGTIHICSSDSSSPEFDIKNIKDVMRVKEIMTECVDACRKNTGIYTTEHISDRPDHSI